MSEPISAVTFICPVFVTGGTEAIHQAAAVMRRQGMPAEIAYHGAGISYAREGDVIRRQDACSENPCQAAFAAYDPQVAREIRLASNRLIVVPEINVLDSALFRPARFAVWWLSVDNAFNHVPRLAEPAVLERLFSENDTLHLHQSEYARRFLIGHRARLIRRLSDVTHRSFLEGTQPGTGRRDLVLFNRKKGLELAQAFFAGNHDLVPYALDGMSMRELRETYRSHTVYVDFGTLPGKDRMPREAAASGCVVFVHNCGAGREMGDFPLPDSYRFDVEDVATGDLARRIRAVLSDPDVHLDAQRHFHEVIAAEEVGFADDVRSIVKELSSATAHRCVDSPRTIATVESGREAVPAEPAARLSGAWTDHADQYCIWVVSPKGYNHHRAFDDVALCLSAGFAERGGSAPVVYHPSEWAGRIPIVLGAHLLAPNMALILPKGSIIYNFEQIDRASGWISEFYLGLMNKYVVLDFSVRNTNLLKSLGICHVRHLALGHSFVLERITLVFEKDIDVLFYGSMNERRAVILENLRGRGLNVVYLFNLYGSERDAMIARAKIILNIHYYESAIFESVRVGYLLANGAFVLTEGEESDPDMAPFKGGLAVCSYDQIADLCVLLLAEDELRLAVANQGRALMRAHRQADRLGELFAPDRVAA